MKYSLFSKILTTVVAVCTFASITGCAEREEELVADYGYVQFKLYKNDTAPKKSTTRAEEDAQDVTLDYLSDVHKLGVSLVRANGSVVEQTLVLHAYSAENAAYGMRSDKLQLLAGDALKSLRSVL
ncbi:MAG: DUF4458 domain-containing protein [Oscillospiraceae bacterium]|nr:DUF4458 domain-containing protein [Oscillospiraceae bacterium]